MNLSEHDLRALWRERSATAGLGDGECLTEADWTRLLSGEGDARERVRLATHIASCATCAEEYRLLEPFKSWMADVDPVGFAAHAAPADRWRTWRSWWALPRIVLATATVLLVTQGIVLSLLVNNRRASTQLETQLAENIRRLSSSEASLDALQNRLRRETAEKERLATAEQQRLAQLSTPHLDAAIADLEPQYLGAVRGSSDPQLVSTPPDALTVTLVLNFPPLAARRTLEIEVADANGLTRWTGRTERNQDTAMLTLALPTAGYPPGRYVIRLFDVTRGHIPLATYPLLIRPVGGKNR
jgi:hypothetical protein